MLYQVIPLFTVTARATNGLTTRDSRISGRPRDPRHCPSSAAAAGAVVAAAANAVVVAAAVASPCRGAYKWSNVAWATACTCTIV